MASYTDLHMYRPTWVQTMKGEHVTGCDSLPWGIEVHMVIKCGRFELKNALATQPLNSLTESFHGYFSDLRRYWKTHLLFPSLWTHTLTKAHSISCYSATRK